MKHRALVVGARTARQGTGRFIAGAFAAAGVDVDSLVGTSAKTAEKARSDLASEFDIDATAYTDLAQALSSEQPDIVLLASPWKFHEAQLQLVAEAGCHCLVEKPMLWPASQPAARHVVGQFVDRDCLLEVVSQWPFALAQFAELHGKLPLRVDTFKMRLSPISIDDSMIPDAAPHFISLLYALAGAGDFSDVAVQTETAKGQARMTLRANYAHANGAIDAQLLLETVPDRPRPAWFEINGLRAEREVTLPTYEQALSGGDHRVYLPDPMASVAHAFLDRLTSQQLTDAHRLLSQHANLCQLAKALPTDQQP